MSNALPLDGSHLDIVSLLEFDHRTLRALFTQILEASPDERAELWPRLVRTLVTHEVAEEMIVFPPLRAVRTDADAILRPRLEEQADAERALKGMESLDPSSPQFASELTGLQRAVLAHAEAEEREILPVIATPDLALDRSSLGVRYENAKRRAPTHPHPGAPDRPPGNVIVGPVTSLLDRIRDHLR